MPEESTCNIANIQISWQVKKEIFASLSCCSPFLTKNPSTLEKMELTNSRLSGILYLVLNNYAALAQLVERFHGKEEVVGSSPTGGSSKNVEFSTFFFCV